MSFIFYILNTENQQLCNINSRLNLHPFSSKFSNLKNERKELILKAITIYCLKV